MGTVRLPFIISPIFNKANKDYIVFCQKHDDKFVTSTKGGFACFLKEIPDPLWTYMEVTKVDQWGRCAWIKDVCGPESELLREFK